MDFSRVKYGRADDGRVIRVIGVHIDITEPKRAEAALRESLAFSDSIMKASADCVMLIDPEGRLAFVTE